MAKKGKEPPVVPHYEWEEFFCGWGAAFINITVTFPINKVMFRQVLKLCFSFNQQQRL